jgi:hypothetical protein
MAPNTRTIWQRSPLAAPKKAQERPSRVGAYGYVSFGDESAADTGYTTADLDSSSSSLRAGAAGGPALIGGYVTIVEESATAGRGDKATRGATKAGGEGRDWADAGKQAFAVDDDGYVDARVCA